MYIYATAPEAHKNSRDFFTSAHTYTHREYRGLSRLWQLRVSFDAAGWNAIFPAICPSLAYVYICSLHTYAETGWKVASVVHYIYRAQDSFQRFFFYPFCSLFLSEAIGHARSISAAGGNVAATENKRSWVNKMFIAVRCGIPILFFFDGVN